VGPSAEKKYGRPTGEKRAQNISKTLERSRISQEAGAGGEDSRQDRGTAGGNTENKIDMNKSKRFDTSIPTPRRKLKKGTASAQQLRGRFMAGGNKKLQMQQINLTRYRSASLVSEGKQVVNPQLGELQRRGQVEAVGNYVSKIGDGGSINILKGKEGNDQSQDSGEG